MYAQSLDGAWQVRESGGREWIPAEVPGCIHTDLLSAGLIPNPFAEDNELRVSWVAEAGWIYKREFHPTPELLNEERIFLECDGLDTLASISINGEEVAGTDNMHRRYSFDVTELLHPGPNTIEISFASPVEYVRRLLGTDPYVTSPADSIPGSPYIRKAMYQWGWDWAPKIPTSGIWRSIRLAGRSFGRIESIRTSQVHGRSRADLSVKVEVERFGDTEITVCARLTSPDGTVMEELETVPEDREEALFDFLIEDPKIWWPAGDGAQPLYLLQIELLSPERTIADTGSLRLGLRTIELRQEQDEWGHTFMFVVNNTPIFAKGANWVPADQFPSRVASDTYTNLISGAARCNMNMLRVWGGGIYEDDRFYDLCDEYGILVWQDFMFACAFYPDDPAIYKNIQNEAVDNIRRIRHHPCLALWCGNNEIEWQLTSGCFNADVKTVTARYSRLFLELLQNICSAEDPSTPYRSSSSSSFEPFGEANSEHSGDAHYWDVWHGRKPFTDYRKHYFRFTSEFGFESLPAIETIAQFARPKDWNMTSRIMENHQKNAAGNELILYYMAHTFRFPRDFEAMVYVSQVLQGEAMRFGVEHWRRNRNGNRCMGTIYWQYNDCWPAASWSGIDYSGRYKALWYFAKRFYAPVLLSAEESADGAVLHVTNDTPSPFTGEVRWSLEQLDGSVLSHGEQKVEVPAESNLQVASLDFRDLLDMDARRQVVLVYQLLYGGGMVSMGMVPFAPSKYLELPDAAVTAGVSGLAEGTVIRLRSSHTARYVMLYVPGYNLRFSDNFFDLPAGRSVEVAVEDPCGLRTEDIAENLRILSLRDSY